MYAVIANGTPRRYGGSEARLRGVPKKANDSHEVGTGCVVCCDALCRRCCATFTFISCETGHKSASFPSCRPRFLLLSTTDPGIGAACSLFPCCPPLARPSHFGSRAVNQPFFPSFSPLSSFALCLAALFPSPTPHDFSPVFRIQASSFVCYFSR
jgi:hypothetical protein